VALRPRLSPGVPLSRAGATALESGTDVSSRGFTASGTAPIVPRPLVTDHRQRPPRGWHRLSRRRASADRTRLRLFGGSNERAEGAGWGIQRGDIWWIRYSHRGQKRLFRVRAISSVTCSAPW
jgi:hypothetical protein